MKNKAIIWQYLCLILISTFLPNISFAQQPLVAVGTWSEQGIDRPLIAVSQDKGLTWSYPPSANQQPVDVNFFRGDLNRVSCNTHFCVAAGSWMDKNAVFRPLLSWSNDAGNTWHYLDMLHQEPVLPKVSSSKLQDITCTEHFCLAAGMYTDTDKLTLPLLARGEYQPEFSWHFLTKSIQPHLPDNFQEGQFNEVSCNKHTCLAAGEYFNEARHRFPLLMRSGKTGKRWKMPVLNLPSDFKEGNFQGIQCDESLCLTVGDYHNGSHTKPFLMLSTDEGKTWHTAAIPMPDNHQEGTLTQVSCEKKWCIAAGALTEDDHSWPFLIYSNDAGKHWHYSDYVSNTGLPEAFYSGQLVYTACNPAMCIAAGSYYTHAGSHPLLAVSNDKGETWLYSPSAQQSSPLALDEDGMYSHAFCNDLLCLATGDFLNTAGIVSPLLAIAKDKGEIWQYPEQINQAHNLPAGLVRAQFRGAS